MIALDWRRSPERLLPAAQDALAAVAALSTLIPAVRALLAAGPGAWVLADVCAAVLMLVVSFGRSGGFARFLSIFIFAGLAMCAVRMMTDGYVLAPALFFVYAWRAWSLERRNPGAAAEDINRTVAAIMVGGIPGAVAHSWGAPASAVEVVIAVPFFLLCAWWRLHPLNLRMERP